MPRRGSAHGACVKSEKEIIEQALTFRRKLETLAVEYAGAKGEAVMRVHLRILEYQNRLATLQWVMGK